MKTGGPVVNTVAWSPLTNPRAMQLATIVCPANHSMNRDYYLGALGDRIQRIVNACVDPQESVESLQEEFLQSGLVVETGHCPAAEAGNRLIASNPGVWEPLEYLGVFNRLHSAMKAPATDDMAARLALLAEKDCPEDGLMSWAGLLGRAVSLFDPELEESSENPPTNMSTQNRGTAPSFPTDGSREQQLSWLLEQGFKVTSITLPPHIPHRAATSAESADAPHQTADKILINELRRHVMVHLARAGSAGQRGKVKNPT